MANFKKIKHGDKPGDIPKKDKIKMREGRFGSKLKNWFLDNIIRPKERAVLKERSKKEIVEQLGE